MDTLTPAQREAVTSDHPRIVCTAVPGAGKTHTLVRRIERLWRAGQDPAQIVCITFTNAASRELQSRLPAGLKLGFCGTLHGWAMRCLTSHGDLIGLPERLAVIDDEQAGETLDRIIAEARYTGTKAAVQASLDGLMRGRKSARTPAPCDLVAKRYVQTLRASGLLTYDLILAEFLRLIRQAAETPNDDSPEHLLVDEFQDSGDLDAAIYDEIPAANKFVVGDVWQCQPTGTVVTMADDSKKRIEDVRNGDIIRSYCRRSKVVIKEAVVDGVASRPYSGELVDIFADGKVTRSTPNHKWLIRWMRSEMAGKICTYLMRKGDYFRVGKAKLIRGRGIGLGFTDRLRQERADAVWVLATHDSETEAVAYEEIVSATYGLPQACFVAFSGSTNFTQDSIDLIFKSIPNQLTKAVKCLQDHGRLLEFPLQSKSARRTRTTVQEVQSCNMMSGIMAVPVGEDRYMYRKRGSRWAIISAVRRTRYEGLVYSMNVRKFHKYISDGIVTCNSIYGFRGGNPEHLQRIETDPAWEHLTLDTNFRSTQPICCAANRLSGRSMVAHRGDSPEHPTVCEFETSEQEMAGLYAELIDGHGTAAVLVRYNAEADRIRQTLASMGVRVAARERSVRPPDWPQARAALAMLTDPANDWLVYWWLKVCGREADEMRRRAVASQMPLGRLAGLDIPDRTENAAYGPALARLGASPESVALVEQAIAANPGATGPELLLALADEEDDWTDGVWVGTYHSAKGREYDRVFLPGFEEGTIPGSQDKVDEDWRLAYVAVTRARDQLWIGWAKERRNQWTGRAELRYASRFIAEMGLV